MSAAPTTTASPPENEVSWPTIFWALVPLALNSMTQPIGRLSPELTAEQSFYLRSSPIICLVDSTTMLMKSICYAIRLRDPVLAARFVARERLESDAVPARLRSVQDNGTVRGLLFVFGALPQAIKLFGCSGIPWSKAFAGMFLGSFAVLELLIVRADRDCGLSGKELVLISRAQTVTIDRMIQFFMFWYIRFSPLLFLLSFGSGSNNEEDESEQQRPWSLMLGAVVAGLAIIDLIRDFTKNKRISKGRLFILLCTVICGAAIFGYGIHHITSIRTSHRGFSSMVTLVVVNYSLHCNNLVRDPMSMNVVQGRGFQWALMSLAATLGYYRIFYDPRGTVKPAWTECLG